VTPWLLAALAVAGAWLLTLGLCRAAARADADEAHRNLLDLLAEQTEARERADARAIADNLDI